jgi:hypothetical protein
MRAWERELLDARDSFELRHALGAYASDLAGESTGLKIESTYHWNSYSVELVGLSDSPPGAR